jgi:hypothetical protein
MMEQSEIQQLVAALQAANQAAATQVESTHDAHCKVRWRRRLIFMTVFIAGAYAIGEATHVEGLLKGWEILAAPLIDKAIFGTGG